MKIQFSFLLLIVSFFFLTSCTDDQLAENPIDEFAHVHNDEYSGYSRNCAMSHKMDVLMSDPEYKKAYQEKIQRVEEALLEVGTRSQCANPKIIPVAIHYQGVSNPNVSCLISLAQNQINILNADFAGSNSDISKWNNQTSSLYPGVANGETCLKFCIADKNHPSGFGLSNGQPAITINKTNGDQANSWSGYMNIFVQSNTGVLGYAPLGGDGRGDGVVIDAVGFGSGNGCGSISPDAPYNLGRTLTHEVGHYLLLDHIWGGGCNSDDDVSDTPDQASDNNGCPGSNTSSCGSRDLHMNYMDYTNDACMYMFTAGQSNRMEAYVNSSLSNLVNNASNVCSNGGATGGGGTDGGGTDGGGTDGGGTDGGGTDGGGTGDGGNTGGTCSTPSSLSVTGITTSSATISWGAEPNAIKYRFFIRKKGTTQWTKSNQTATTKTVNNLQANTQYQYRVRTHCPAGWTALSPVKTFTTESAGGNGGNGGNGGGTGANVQDVRIDVVLDDYGSETSWELVNDNYKTVATGGPYADGQSGAKKSKTVSLPVGCYTLYLDDAYGDGICCDYGDGYLEVVNNGTVIAESDGYFGYYDTIEFCVSNTGARLSNQKKDKKVTLQGAKVAKAR